MQQIGIKTIQQALRNKKSWMVRTAALHACQEQDVPIRMIQRGAADPHWSVRTAAMNLCVNRNIPLWLIGQGLNDKDLSVQAAAAQAYAGRKLSFQKLEQWIQRKDGFFRLAAMNTASLQAVPFAVKQQWLQDKRQNMREAALKAFSGQQTAIPLSILEQGLTDRNKKVREAAKNACVGQNIPLSVICKWLAEKKNWHKRAAAMLACIGQDIPFSVIQRGLTDEDHDVREAAMRVCMSIKYQPVPNAFMVDQIARWLQDDEDSHLRVTALQACVRWDVPAAIIRRRLTDENQTIRKTATMICKQKGIALPLVRMVEPPPIVYKKCIGDVIVCAQIPADAQVRGQEGTMCRADKAIICRIIGDFYGEKVGISLHNQTTTYWVGDTISVEDFDMSNDLHSSGFHFFCSRKEAERFSEEK